MEEQFVLSQSLAWFLYGRSISKDLGQAQVVVRRAVEAAQQWPDSWISKAISIHANTWFFYEARDAMEVLGGPDRFTLVMEADALLRHFTTAVGALCGRRYEEELANLQAAASLEHHNPFIEALTVIALFETDSPHLTLALEGYLSRHRDHPLTQMLGLGKLTV